MKRGPNGNIVSKLTWEEYGQWQRWDEYPERKEDPPLTVETSFWYKNKEYMVTSLRHEYVIIIQPSFEEVISNKNFITLLNMPFIDGKSFKELLTDLYLRYRKSP